MSTAPQFIRSGAFLVGGLILDLLFCGTILQQGLFAAEPELSIRQTEQWTNLFAGQSVALSCEIHSLRDVEATFSWSLIVAGGIIARGEKEAMLDSTRPTNLQWDVNIPEVKSGLIVPAVLKLVVCPHDERASIAPIETKVSLSIFSSQITTHRRNWLKSLNIVLFDPVQRTAEVFEKGQIPFRLADNPRCSELTDGPILYGEGLEAAQIEVVWNEAVAAASAGRRVLVMASAGGSVPAIGSFTAANNSPFSITLKRNEIINELDNRLDSLVWPGPCRLGSTSMHWTARGEQIRLDFRDNSEGWPWLDLHYPNRGRLIWMGFGIVKSWEATPSARYLLLKVLEELSDKKPADEGEFDEN